MKKTGLVLVLFLNSSLLLGQSVSVRVNCTKTFEKNAEDPTYGDIYTIGCTAVATDDDGNVYYLATPTSDSNKFRKLTLEVGNVPTWQNIASKVIEHAYRLSGVYKSKKDWVSPPPSISIDTSPTGCRGAGTISSSTYYSRFAVGGENMEPEKRWNWAVTHKDPTVANAVCNDSLLMVKAFNGVRLYRSDLIETR